MSTSLIAEIQSNSDIDLQNSHPVISKDSSVGKKQQQQQTKTTTTKNPQKTNLENPTTPLKS